MKKNFKECKEVFENYSNGTMNKEEFDKWSKENCKIVSFMQSLEKDIAFLAAKSN